MKENTNPLFTDITWGAGGSTADLSLDLALHMHQTGHVANMHLTCTNTTEASLREVLDRCKSKGLQNILALRGDPPTGATEWTATDAQFKTATDLVRFIRKEYGDYFCIGVAAYPEGHTDFNGLLLRRPFHGRWDGHRADVDDYVYSNPKLERIFSKYVVTSNFSYLSIFSNFSNTIF